jgi:hypothetical protein
MPVLALLILIDLTVIGIVMYFVLSEKPKQHTTSHPFVTEAQKNEEKAHREASSDKETPEKTEEKTDQV